MAKEDQLGVYSPVKANKYFLQSAIMHRGMGIDIGLGSGYYITRGLSSALAGVVPAQLEVEIDSSAADILAYTFSSPDGDSMIGLWKHNTTSDFDPGTQATITFPDFSANRVVVIDLIQNLEQELITRVENGNLVIENVLVKDYPLLIKLEN